MLFEVCACRVPSYALESALSGTKSGIGPQDDTSR